LQTLEREENVERKLRRAGIRRRVPSSRRRRRVFWRKNFRIRQYVQSALPNITVNYQSISLEGHAAMDRYQGVDIEWRDVTAFLPQAARDIPVGKLVHTGWFTLREAVAAIEVMDPKMDTGRVSDADAADPFVSVEDRIERGFVPVDGISDDDLIDIFDDILAAEVRHFPYCILI